MHFTAPTVDLNSISRDTVATRITRQAHVTAKRAGSALALAFALLLPAAHAADMVSVDVPTLNMRDSAGTNRTILWKLSRGYPLHVLERKGSWLKVRDFENDQGWVYRAHTGKKPHHIVKAKIANIRSGPGATYKVVGKAARGDLFQTMEKRAGWVKVKDEMGVKGWIARSLLWGW